MHLGVVWSNTFSMEVLTVTIFILFCVINGVFSYELKQVVIIGRHNMRAPLMKKDVEKATLKSWPKWYDKIGDLTEKGALLEYDMGKYFSQWFNKEVLFKNCPENETHFYSNGLHRTFYTAKKFAEGLFGNCNITVEVDDKCFSAVVQSNSEVYRNKSIEEIEKKLEKMDLSDAYERLNEILDIKNSRFCTEESLCDLTRGESKVVFELNKLPDVEGPLGISNAAIDAFLMAYYHGATEKDIGWGAISNKDWRTFSKISKGYFEARYNATFSADIAKPLLTKIYQIITNNHPKLAVFIGHESNLITLTRAMKFKPFVLPNTYGCILVGAKLVFQKWYDEIRDTFLLKMDFVYRTTQQMRFGSTLSRDNPPNSVTVELSECAVNENGFCLWSCFINVLRKLVTK